MNQSFMKEKAVFPMVFSMSIPMVLSMLVNSLYNIVDSYFVAKISEDAMTALSLVYPLQILVMAAGVGFGIGINAAASYFLGKKESAQANNAVSSGLLLSALHGVFLTIVCILASPSFLRLFSQNADVISYGLDYSYIVFAFCVPITTGIAFEKIFQAEGQMTISMLGMLSGCVVNILLDPLLIFGLGPIPAMGMKGAAWATGIGQLFPLGVYLIIYFKKPLPLKLCFHKKMMSAKLCGRLYAVGIPASLNIALPSLLIASFNRILALYAETYVLVLGIYFKLQTFIYLTANGIVQGIRPLVGYNYGAAEYGRVREIFRTALKLILAVMAVGMVICLTASRQLIGLFTENVSTLEIGQTALQIISLGFVASAVSVTVSGTLEGLGKGAPSLAIALMRYTVIIIPAAFLLSKFFGAAGVWHAFWIAEVITALAAVILYRKCVLQKLLTPSMDVSSQPDK